VHKPCEKTTKVTEGVRRRSRRRGDELGEDEAAYNLTEARQNLQEIWAAFSRSKI